MRGKLKGGTRIAPRSGGDLLYVLETITRHRPDPGILPDEAAMRYAALTALQGLIFDQANETQRREGRRVIAGGHQASVKKEDLLDGFEILEHTLIEIVDLKARRAKMAKLSEELEKNTKRPGGVSREVSPEWLN